MCENPVWMPKPDGTRAQVGCRKCWQCRSVRIDDYVGRCLAEAWASDKTLALTLTYADEAAAHLLNYRDVQNLFKRLRHHGHKIRYIGAGEYGSRKGRAHWHVILFFKGKVPDVPLNVEQFMWEHWPHGYTYFQPADERGFKYLLKYALKGLETEQFSGKVFLSKKPPLGRRFLHGLSR